MSYQCGKCDMAVEDIECAKCHCPCAHDEIDHEGSKIGVSQCPSCKGMIKSPQCCGQDMSHQ